MDPDIGSCPGIIRYVGPLDAADGNVIGFSGHQDRVAAGGEFLPELQGDA